MARFLLVRYQQRGVVFGRAVDVPVYRPPVYRFALFAAVFFSCHPVTPVYRWYAGIPGWFIFSCSRSPSCCCTLPHTLLHTTQHAGCCGQQPTLAYTPCHVRQENYANLVTALPPQNSPAAAHAEVACTAFAVILMTTRKSTQSLAASVEQRTIFVRRKWISFMRGPPNQPCRPTSEQCFLTHNWYNSTAV